MGSEELQQRLNNHRIREICHSCWIDQCNKRKILWSEEIFNKYNKDGKTACLWDCQYEFELDLLGAKKVSYNGYNIKTERNIGGRKRNPTKWIE